jgi:hypothetical protein
MPRSDLVKRRWSGIGTMTFLTLLGMAVGILAAPGISHRPAQMLYTAQYRIGGSAIGFLYGLMIMVSVGRFRFSLMLMFEVVLCCALVAYQIASYLRVAEFARSWGL